MRFAMNAVWKTDAADRPIAINGKRLWDSLMEMAKIGATPKGGVCRLALTDLDKQGRDLFVQWAKDAGCTITIDRMGNIFARRKGRDDSLSPARMPIRSPPAASSMASTACSAGWK
jgi:N-carbamoyl-L-amino-acid hydrolase